jgi:hypothetical protein
MALASSISAPDLRPSARLVIHSQFVQQLTRSTSSSSLRSSSGIRFAHPHFPGAKELMRQETSCTANVS